MAVRYTSATKNRWGWGSSLLVMGLALGVNPNVASAQEAPAPDDEIVVTGFRGSLAQSLNVKREASGFVDAITAEDIGQFPDLNLAESLQRIPGVAIDRDAGEGRTITVRGLAGQFTRTRVNGMETQVSTGGTDASGGNNRGRSFDFNIFASDLFNQLKVSKSQSASMEEGSLGATIDLTTGRPLDYDGFQLAVGAQAAYNDLSQTTTPRATFLISDRWETGIGDVGALFSAAYGTRNVFTEGSSTVRWENPSFGNAGIGNPGAGVVFPCPTSVQPPAANYNPTSGAPLTCGTIGVGTVTPATFVTPTNPAAAGTANNLYHPRIPRYGRLTYEQERIGMTGALQWAPSPSTMVTLDALYASFTGTRREQFLEALSFSRSTQGMAQTDVVNFTASNSTLARGQFDDIDARSEDRTDELSTIFSQYSLTVDHDFTDQFRVHAFVGTSLSRFNNPRQTTTSIERYNVDGYTYDYTGNDRLPSFDYNFDVASPSNWTFSTSAATGDASLIRIRPQSTRNSFDVVALDFAYDLTDALTLAVGFENRGYTFDTVEARRPNNIETPPPLSAGDCNGDGVRGDCTMADITEILTDFGRNLDMPAGNDTTWVSPNLDAIARAFNIYCNCIDEGPNGVYNSTAGPDAVLRTGDDVVAGDDIDYRTNVGSGGGVQSLNRSVSEDTRAFYAQLNFDTDLGGMRVRGDIGVRYVETETDASSNLAAGTVVTAVSVPNAYEDTLPSFNLVVEPMENVQVRFAAAKAMSRADLPNLSPGGSVAAGPPISISIGNPLLEPIRSTNYDVGFEWYFMPEAVLSAAYFYKDVESFQQNFRREVTFAESGLPDGSVAGATPTTVVQLVQFVNTPGGILQGYELGYQQPFTFLPGILANFGTIVNYTHVESEVDYFTNIVAPPATPSTITESLVGLSPNSWNATIYYEDDHFHARVSGAFRDRYLIGVPGGSGNDVRGKDETLNIDAQISYTVNDRLSFSVEGLNLTDQFNDQWLNSALDMSEVYEHTGRQYIVGLRYKY